MPDESASSVPVTDARARTPVGVRLAAAVLLVVVVPLVLVILAEGSASLVLFARDAAAAPAAARAENLHTRHDTLLGWINRPGVVAPDLYGPGIALRTNAQGFRGRDEVTASRQGDRRRLVCSGDSFTLGYGVADEHTWCELLARSTGMQGVNMGQGGYGFDQAWLWYRRDGLALEHDVHVLAFITDDFRRAGTTEFLGYAKPRLRVAGDSLRLENVPVPEPGAGERFRRFAPALRALRLSQLAERLAKRLRGDEPARPDLPAEEIDAIFARVAGDLARVNRAKGSTLVLVFLPMLADARQEWSTPWRIRVRAVADSLGVPFVDFVEELRALPGESRQPLFLAQEEVSFPLAAGHLSNAGNAWVAERLHARLAGTLSWLPPVPEARATGDTAARR